VICPGLLIFSAAEVRGGTQVWPPSELALKNKPPLPSVQATYTLFPLLETVGSVAFPKSWLKLTALLKTVVPAAKDVGTTEDGMISKTAQDKMATMTKISRCSIRGVLSIPLKEMFGSIYALMGDR
jgi:hypothetical protein